MSDAEITKRIVRLGAKVGPEMVFAELVRRKLGASTAERLSNGTYRRYHKELKEKTRTVCLEVLEAMAS